MSRVCLGKRRRRKASDSAAAVSLEVSLFPLFCLCCTFDVSRLSSCSARFPDSSPITSQRLRFPTNAAMNCLPMRQSSETRRIRG